ncbi:MAG: Ribosome-binding factor A [Chlamydiae bacterium]|nr:Ribosome-binding factor A [Chlamydiota bacterium]
MAKKRTDRLNSLLKEVLSEVIRKEVHNPFVNEFVTVTRVDISRDLRHAKVYISMIGSDNEKAQTQEALESAAGYISVKASKQVVMRFFPSLKFIIDDTVQKQMRVEELLKDIHTEENARKQNTFQEENSDS